MGQVKSGNKPLKSGAPLCKALARSRKIVLKVGSNVLTGADGEVNHHVLRNIVRQVNELIKRGKKVVIVSSGARGAGYGRIRKWKLKPALNYNQALCAVGQIELMKNYQRGFDRYGRHTAQMLLISDDFDDRLRYLNIRNTLTTLLGEGVVPIINENDSVCTDEIRIGDNDNLAALITTMWNADVLVILSNVDGVYGRQGKNGRRELMKVFRKAGEFDQIENIGRSKWGSGGIHTKLAAARRVGELNISTVILNGLERDVILKALDGKYEKGTVIIPRGKIVPGKKRWLAYGKRPRGKLIIDSGAEEALVKRGRSLLPVGVELVEGNFEAGDLVSIMSTDGRLVGRGLVQYGSDELRKILGRKLSEIEAVLGYKTFDEVIHRDNMVIL